MQIVTMKADGTITVEMTAAEAQEVRDDLGRQPASKVSRSGDQLHSLLEWATPGMAS
jgi:hypothetical protein